MHAALGPVCFGVRYDIIHSLKQLLTCIRSSK